MMVDTANTEVGKVEPQPQIFGDVVKRTRSQGTATVEGTGDFSMIKVPADGGRLVGTVGSVPQRLW
ncbi:unnamed protein product [Choristocarpus tenellus]